MDLNQYNEPELPPDAPLPDALPPNALPLDPPPPAHELTESPTPAPEPSQPAEPPPVAPAPLDGASGTKRRARGKISRLKPPVRERINHMLDEGDPYPDIVDALKTDVPDLKPMDISRWYYTGHQDWLKNQLWLENTRSRLDHALEVIVENEGSNVHLANLHIAATQVIHDLTERGQALLTDHTEQYVAVINSIARIGHEALNFQKYREACAQAREAISPLRDPHRKLTDEETRAIADKVDRILGFK